MAAADRVGKSLSIAVLGPGLDTPGSPGSRKRRQIHDELERDGHSPFFPEDRVSAGPTQEPLLDQETRLLASAEVDLVIILHTSESVGTLMEIADFRRVPEIKSKTAILFPIQYYTPDEALAANTVREYFVRMPYSDAHFAACRIVSECRKWASDLAAGRWPSFTPFGF